MSEHHGKTLLQAIIGGLSGVTPGPWSRCSDKCQCTSVRCADYPIAEVVKGKWGDTWPSLRFKTGSAGSVGETTVEAFMATSFYGEVPVEEAMANRSHIARCDPASIEAIASYVSDLEARLEKARKVIDALASSVEDLRVQNGSPIRPAYNAARAWMEQNDE